MSSRFRYIALSIVACIAAAPCDAFGDGDDLVRVTSQCEPAHEPGRVRCDVEAKTTAPRIIRWGDVEVARTAAFIVPLKGRIAPRDATLREEQTWRWGLAFVARSVGAGEIGLRVRVVVCEANGVCTSRVVETTAKLVVGG